MRVLAWNAGCRTLVGYRPPLRLADDYAVAELLVPLAAESTAAG